ncbi:hypothetical protein SAMN02982929_06170 [Saccharopolyspora kobensis]|uniref:Uncharacterized protein n=1 Tax=Saccharopolyspora kobensis TaxID=146035 RepID=A0A1H6EC53_9PSEU|nr:hypothetical protein SAMN02982929_06170 [Saccharopolyspora kobensis]SFD57365.1 hypothetical protein SAMN05216506_105116 [Saccharopolyspora kobensis]
MSLRPAADFARNRLRFHCSGTVSVSRGYSTPKYSRAVTCGSGADLVPSGAGPSRLEAV